MGFPAFWDHKPTNAIDADSPGVYTIEKIKNLTTINKIHLKCDVIDGSTVNGIRKPIMFSFSLHISSGYKVFCQPGSIQSKRTNKSVRNSITYYLEDNDKKGLRFNGKTLNFKLQLIKT